MPEATNMNASWSQQGEYEELKQYYEQKFNEMKYYYEQRINELEELINTNRSRNTSRNYRRNYRRRRPSRSPPRRRTNSPYRHWNSPRGRRRTNDSIL